MSGCEKRGQAKLFVLIAVVIVAIAGLFYFLIQGTGMDVISEEKIVSEGNSKALAQTLQSCVEDEIGNSLSGDIKSDYSRLLIWDFFNSVEEDSNLFMENLRENKFTPELRVESGFGFSKEVYDFFEYDYSDSKEVRKQARLLKEAGVNQVQIYLLRWSEVDSNGKPFSSHDEVNDRIVEILEEEGLEIHVEFFTHHNGLFESKLKNPNSVYAIDVPINQISPLVNVVDEGLVPQFENYVYNTVKRYPQIKSWGFLNEVDQWNAWDFNDLILLQNKYYDAVKAANPDALVGSASPTFPELLAPEEKLNSEVFDSLGFYYDENEILKRKSNTIITNATNASWGITYPEVYNKWKSFYEKAEYDFVQIHQLGVGFWPDAKWYYNPSSSSGRNSDSLQWELVKAGVNNVREMVGDVPITSQVDIGVHENSSEIYPLDYWAWKSKDKSSPISYEQTPNYWENVQNNFREATSGKYGFDFIDIYHMRENWYEYYNSKSKITRAFYSTETYIFDKNAEPSPLYDEIKSIYSDYSSRLNQEFVSHFFRKFYPIIYVVNDRVGIGTDEPSQKLDVTGYVKGTGLCIGSDCRTSWPNDGVGGSNLWNLGTGDILFYNDGNVGIGTSSPTQKLDVSGKIKANEFCLGINCISSWPIGNGSGDVVGGESGLWSSGNEAIYYDGGNVGIGASNPLSSLSVGANGLSGVGVYTVGTKYGLYSASAGEGGLRADGGYYGIFGVGKNVGVYGSGGSTGVGVYGHNSKIGVRGDGTLYDFYAAGAGENYATASSMRWKDNVTEIDPQIALSKILQLKGSYFNWNIYDGAHDMGFIAEELGKVVPEVVQYETDTSNPLNWYIDENGVKKIYAEGVDYGALTPMIVQAIKGQQELIEKQEEEIDLLNERIDSICLKNPGLC